MSQHQPIVKEPPLKIAIIIQQIKVQLFVVYYAEHDLDAEKIQGSGVGGRITREDIAREVARRDAQKRNKM